jgi:hypothetical protein
MQERNNKVYLATELEQHRIWQNIGMWSGSLKITIDNKIAELMKNVPPELEADHKKTIGEGIKDLT